MEEAKFLTNFRYDISAFKEDGSEIDWMSYATKVSCSGHKIVVSVLIPNLDNILVGYLSEVSFVKRIKYEILDEFNNTRCTISYVVDDFIDWNITSISDSNNLLTLNLEYAGEAVLPVPINKEETMAWLKSIKLGEINGKHDTK